MNPLPPAAFLRPWFEALVPDLAPCSCFPPTETTASPFHGFTRPRGMRGRTDSSGCGVEKRGVSGRALVCSRQTEAGVCLEEESLTVASLAMASAALVTSSWWLIKLKLQGVLPNFRLLRAAPLAGHVDWICVHLPLDPKASSLRALFSTTGSLIFQRIV